MEEILAKLAEVNDNVSSLRDKVDRLKEERTARSRSPVRPRSGFSEPGHAELTGRGLWCDRDPSEKVNYLAPVSFAASDDEVEGDGSGDQQLVEVSEEIGKLLTDSCARRVSNELRRKTRSPYPLPRVPATRTPRIDHFVRTEIPQASKSLDKDLAKIQTFTLDTISLLTAMIEKLDTISRDDLQLALTCAIQLVGNASARISHLRREKILTDVNKSLLPLVKEDKDYMLKPTPTSLDQVKAIRSSLPNTSEANKKQSLFWKGQASGRSRPFKKGGGQNQFKGGRGGRQARQENNRN